MMTRLGRISRIRSTCQWTVSTSARVRNVGIFSLQMESQKTACSRFTDDCLAWKFTLQDSRTNTAYVGSAVLTDETSVVSSPPPYTAYAAPAPEQAYGYGPYSGAYPPGTQVVYAANGMMSRPYQYPYAGLYGQQPANQVIIRERYRDNDSDLALGMLAGAATGMALGSLFWVF
uniref:Pleckstrin homology domain-containing family B member 2 n=1 Tax=Macaca fascicularis TaxID=9541 RepID=A0A7N9IGS4_MACFA